MADIPTLDAAPDAPAAKPAGKRSKLILIIVAVLILAGGGVGAWMFLAPGEKPKEAHEHTEPKAPPLYVALEPPFVVNFESEQLVRFLQITVQVMTREPEVLEQIKANDPVIRNDLLMLFGNQSYQTVATREGKEKLRADALNTVRKIIKTAGGKPESIEAVYFTSFVMQ